MKQLSLLSSAPQRPARSARTTKPIAPTAKELRDAVYLQWVRVNNGFVPCYPMVSSSPIGPTRFRDVLRAQLRMLLLDHFESEASVVLSEYKARALGIAEWLRDERNALPREVTAYIPCHGPFGDPPCCELDPLYNDVDAIVHFAKAHESIREQLAAAGWGTAATEPMRICSQCRARVATAAAAAAAAGRARRGRAGEGAA